MTYIRHASSLPANRFDRDLTLAGRVLIRQANGNIKAELVRINRPIIRIPNLAIHLQSDEERSGFSPNLQNHLPPILASEIKAKLEQPPPTSSSSSSSSSSSPVADLHHPLLLTLLAEEIGGGVTAEQIVDFELQICDVQPSTVGGALKEFIFSGRLDNLASSYQALAALIDSSSGAVGAASLKEEKNVRLCALFDHEEVGRYLVGWLVGWWVGIHACCRVEDDTFIHTYIHTYTHDYHRSAASPRRAQLLP